jgi:hypothetical protein
MFLYFILDEIVIVQEKQPMHLIMCLYNVFVTLSFTHVSIQHLRYG